LFGGNSLRTFGAFGDALASSPFGGVVGTGATSGYKNKKFTRK